MIGKESAPSPKDSSDATQTVIGKRKYPEWLLPVGLFAIPLLLFAIYFKVMFAGLINPDAMDFAQLARNLGAGRGFTTYVLRPLALEGRIDPARLPDMTHGPLYPFILAVTFGVLGAKDSVAACISGFFYVITVPVVYFFGKRLFNPTVAIASAALFTLNPLVLDYAVSGLHVTLYIFLSSSLFLTLYHLAAQAKQNSEASVDRINGKLLSLAGIISGALYLTDSAFFWIIPALIGAVALVHPLHRAKAALSFTASALIVMTPWMLRNGLTTGNPVFGLKGAEVWMNTQVYPGSSGYRMFSGEFVPDINLFNSILRKAMLGFNQILRTLPTITIAWALAFFLPSLLFQFKDKSAENVRRIALACFAALTLEMLFFSVQLPLFVGIINVFMMFALAYVQHLIQQARLYRIGAASFVGLLALTVIYPLINDMFLKDRPQPLRLSPTARDLGKMMAPGEICISDQPWVTAWYANRPSAWIPAKDEKMAELRKRLPQTHWLYLTEQTKSFSPSWEYVYSSLNRWNAACIIADVQKSPRPSEIVIDGNGQPLPEALSGFSSVAVPPVSNFPTGVVMAKMNTASAQNVVIPVSDH